MRTRIFLYPALAATVLLSGCVVPPPRHAEVRAHERGYLSNHPVRVVFTDRDRAIIRNYYDERRRHLPPGHARQMAEGRVPHGQQNRYLPYDLERRLPPLPEGYVRVLINADVAIMNVRTHAIVDVMRGIAGN